MELLTIFTALWMMATFRFSTDFGTIGYDVLTCHLQHERHSRALHCHFHNSCIVTPYHLSKYRPLKFFCFYHQHQSSFSRFHFVCVSQIWSIVKLVDCYFCTLSATLLLLQFASLQTRVTVHIYNTPADIPCVGLVKEITEFLIALFSWERNKTCLISHV